jgi:hypothetical protein
MKIHKEVLAPVGKLTNLLNNEEGEHIWQFSRIGGENRVNLLSGADLANLESLDQKLWTALSCPVFGMEIDDRTLALIDTDNDQRIRVPEVIAAAKWLVSLVNNPDDLVQQNHALPLSAINTSSEEGEAIYHSALQILRNLGRPEQTALSVAEVSDLTAILADARFNGDGVIVEDSTDDEELKKLIGIISTLTGSATDKSGKTGITEEHLNDFFTQCTAYEAWYAAAEQEDSGLLPFGTGTSEAYASYLALKSKIDDYFLRCKVAEFDKGSAAQWNLFQPQAEQLSPENLAERTEAIAAFPIAMGYQAEMPLTEGINPSWRSLLDKLRAVLLTPLFPGRDRLSQEEWDSIPGHFAAWNEWQAAKAGAAVEPLGIDQIRAYLKGEAEAAIREMIALDKSLEVEINNIGRVERLTRYYCDFYKLLRNFVTFTDFYTPGGLSMFQAGRLYIDQRCCDLCIRVNDLPKHNMMAGYSGICLVYCDCTSKTKNEKMTIVAALTDGDIDNIMVGRNAIFYDRQNCDWDTTIVKIIDNPISIRQAFWSPYKKMSRMIAKQMEKVASSKEKAVDSSISSGVDKSTSHVESGINRSIQANPAPAASPAAPAAPPFDIGKFVGIFAAISLALGAIGTVIMSILTGFLKLTWWQMPLAIIGIVLAISLPSMVIAYLKLRKRDLAPVLDANGWAINARVTVNILFGKTLTHLVSLPPNSKVNLIDPFQRKKKAVWPALLIILALIAIATFVMWRYYY